MFKDEAMRVISHSTATGCMPPYLIASYLIILCVRMGWLVVWLVGWLVVWLVGWLAGLAYMYIYKTGVYSALRGQKKAPNFLQHELPRVVSCHVCARNHTQVLWKSSVHSYLLGPLSVPFILFQTFYHTHLFIHSLCESANVVMHTWGQGTAVRVRLSPSTTWTQRSDSGSVLVAALPAEPPQPHPGLCRLVQRIYRTKRKKKIALHFSSLYRCPLPRTLIHRYLLSCSGVLLFCLYKVLTFSQRPLGI